MSAGRQLRSAVGSPHVFGALTCVTLLFASTPSNAQTITLSDSTAESNLVQVSPGAPFTININFNSGGRPYDGLTYLLETTAAGSGLFSITGRTVSGTLPEDFQNTSANGTVTNSANNVIVERGAGVPPRNGADLGYSHAIVPRENWPAEPGQQIATLTLTASASAPAGFYTLFASTNSKISNAAAQEFAVANGATYTVQVIPEPASAAILGLSLAGLVLRRRRGA